MYLLPPANEVWGKEIFLEACVKNSVHRGGWSAPGGCLLLRGAWSGGVCSREAVCLFLGGMPGGDPSWMATAAGGMHPTGMHSCLIYFITIHKQSCGKVMFLHLSMILGRHPPGKHLPCRQPPGQTPLHPQEDTHPPGKTPLGRHPPPPGDGYCSRWYASYWNAFLLLPANVVWGKVIFSQASVILFRGCALACTPPGHAHPPGHTLPPGMHTLLGHARPLPPNGYHEMRSMSGPYASYWNAFLFIIFFQIMYCVPLEAHVPTRMRFSSSTGP